MPRFIRVGRVDVQEQAPLPVQTFVNVDEIQVVTVASVRVSPDIKVLPKQITTITMRNGQDIFTSDRVQDIMEQMGMSKSEAAGN